VGSNASTGSVCVDDFLVEIGNMDDHSHYVNQEQYSVDTADFDLRHGTLYKAGCSLEYRTAKPYGEPITLSNDYHFAWESIGGVYFLKYFIEKNRSRSVTQ
jgi:hypothetical protein